MWKWIWLKKQCWDRPNNTWQLFALAKQRKFITGILQEHYYYPAMQFTHTHTHKKNASCLKATISKFESVVLHIIRHLVKSLLKPISGIFLISEKANFKLKWRNLQFNLVQSYSSLNLLGLHKSTVPKGSFQKHVAVRKLDIIFLNAYHAVHWYER